MFSVLKNENNFTGIQSETEFNRLALSTFRYQVENNRLYRAWVQHLGVDAEQVHVPEQIPFLPIEFFKHQAVVCGEPSSQATRFYSSGTTGQIPSVHVVNNLALYEASFMAGFTRVYGPVEDYCILALLPNYLEREGSSLVYMVHHLIAASKHAESGFFLHQYQALANKLEQLRADAQKVMLIGVSYALLDLCDYHPRFNADAIVMETGGMKGKRAELLKPELHALLKKGFGVNSIHSEYGMTELLSQAYSQGDGRFECPPWMKVLIRRVDDPLSYCAAGKTGGINVIDLANRESCSFIATKDLGRVYEDGGFEIMGRYNQSDVRGCNLMVENY